MNEDNPIIEKTKDNLTIEVGNIVWFKSNNQINCGIVEKVEDDKKTIFVFNYDVWSLWVVSFEEIVRVGVSYLTDDYRNWMTKLP